MKLEKFLKFVDKTLDELILYAEVLANKDFKHYELNFKWRTFDKTVTVGRENITYEIADKVYLTEDKIYPCVDLTIEILDPEEQILNITGARAGYEPAPFQNGWTGRPGPFIYFIGKGIKSRTVNTSSPEFLEKITGLGLINDEGKEIQLPTIAKKH